MATPLGSKLLVYPPTTDPPNTKPRLFSQEKTKTQSQMACAAEFPLTFKSVKTKPGIRFSDEPNVSRDQKTYHFTNTQPSLIPW